MGIIAAIIISIIGFGISALFQEDVYKEGRELQRKFIALGDMRGMPKGEMISKVGPPTAVSAMGDGCSLLQWQRTGYHICIVFNIDNTVQGISSEYAAQQ